ncbi:uncharacterized protein LOC110732199 [Chenopodium quinoa]|uniref:uncharacterized protein LOC110732199 n=1 Tax=Chenopodium quinoa TaxID=63459 RepID=UPI000B78958D|nr:uncharacterized protein LOC110732199 [Chenopodium quinoa]
MVRLKGAKEELLQGVTDRFQERIISTLLVLCKQWDIQQLDINNAFLHGFLDEEVYMNPPPGYKKAQPGQDLGSLKYFLGIEVSRSGSGIFLNQRKYILDLLRDQNMENCNAAPFPMSKGLRLNMDNGDLLGDPEVYRRLIGKLLYLNMSRPGISYVVQQISQFLGAPRKPHFDAALHVLRYLKGSLNFGLFYPTNSDFVLTGYNDADWGTCSDSGRSLTGYCVFLGNSLISWKTKKQKVVSKSSTEAEYRSMSHTADELIWLERLLAELDITIPTPLTLYCDNVSAIHIAENPCFHEKTKHMRGKSQKIDVHYIREQVQYGFIQLKHVRSVLQLADIMTKPLGSDQHRFLSSKIGLVNNAPIQEWPGISQLAHS